MITEKNLTTYGIRSITIEKQKNSSRLLSKMETKDVCNLAFTDILGSILYVMDEKRTKVFDASYDAWG